MEGNTTRYPDYAVLNKSSAAPASEGTIAYKINELRDANASLRDMANQAEQLANRIAGSRPEKGDATAGPASVPNGLIEEMDHVHADFRASTARLGNALNRIQQII